MTRLLLRHDGVTLLELLMAVILVVAVVTALSLFYPNASTSYIHNRNRLVARQLAFSMLDDIEKRPYDAIPVTAANTALPANCDCNSIIGSTPNTRWPLTIDSATELEGQPVADNQLRDGITYYRQACIALVGVTAGVWDHYCPGSTDPGMKNIRVHVTWTTSNNVPQFIDLESVATQG